MGSPEGQCLSQFPPVDPLKSTSKNAGLMPPSLILNSQHCCGILGLLFLLRAEANPSVRFWTAFKRTQPGHVFSA